MKFILLTLLTLGLMFQIAFAQNFNKEKLDNYFNALDSNNKFMGSVAVSKDGKLFYSNTVGFSDFENKIKADENTLYRIGSISKTFTAILVLKGVEENKIDLNQTIDKYFPSIKNAHKITIENLLYHRSGIHSFTNDEDYLTWNTEPKTQKEMVAIIAKGGSDFEPDKSSQYSNSNYVLLSYILEDAFGKSYGELIGEYITKPIGLEHTYFDKKNNSSNKMCKSYKYYDTWQQVPDTDFSIPMGAGGIVSTPQDLVKFSDALFNGELLDDKSLEKMKNIKDNFGMGLFQIPFNGEISYGHTGGIDGFSSVFSHFSDDNISYALISNGTNFNNNDISIAVLSAIFNLDYDIPEFTTYEVSSDELVKYTGVYSTTQLPLKITITIENNTLIAQATGQEAFPLEAFEKNKFKYDQAGVVMEFNPEENSVILNQGGGTFTFNKE